MRILLTGASGFVGRILLQQLTLNAENEIRAAMRSKIFDLQAATDIVVVGDIDADTKWQTALAGVDVVIHCAARVHIMNDQSVDPLMDFRKTNVEGSLNLARQAAAVGVQRFVYVSSVKVNGEQTPVGRPFTEEVVPAPADPYGRSKMEAEHGLLALARDTGLEVIVIRPPLVYGPGVKANFLRLIKAVQKGLPLPMGLVRNKRSLVAIDNLVDLIVTCIDHPAAAGQTFLVSDGEDLSTPELVRKLARAMGKKARLLPVPPVLLRIGGRMIGKGGEVERLIGSLQVDISHTCETLGWHPPVSVDEGIRRCVGR